MREKYCKYCGRDLEFGRCSCDDFVLHENMKKDPKYNNQNNNLSLTCDSCGKKIDVDSIYCPYCGLPVKVDGKIQDLQKELRGDNSKDVIDIYSKEMKPKDRFLFPTSFVVTLSLATLLVGILIGYAVIPGLKNTISDFTFRQNAEESESVDMSGGPSIVEEATIESTEETTEEPTGPRDEWVTVDGDTYAYDIEGNMIVDSWVSETDANGVEQNYYFGKDGKLLKDDWVDENFYVGSDGAMLRETTTPDGIYLDEDGMAVIPDENLVTVEEDTNTYYEAPDSNSKTVNQNQTSSTSVKILGVEAGKSYPLYIKKAIRVDDKIKSGNNTCDILYYFPTIEGSDEIEVETINKLYQDAFYKDFIEQVKNYALSLPELPESIKFTTLEQKNAKSNNYRVILSGKIKPRSGLTENLKFTFIYNRKNETIKVQNSTALN